jgi:hypothetical protein
LHGAKAQVAGSLAPAGRGVRPGAVVRDFEIYIDDSRYATPTFVLVQASDEQGARAIAAQKLAEDERHRGVEVWESGVRLFGLGSFADRAGDGSPAGQEDPG